MLKRSLVCCRVAMGLVAAPHATAQNPTVQRADTLAGEWAMEQQVEERWMHARQQPRFTQFLVDNRWIVVDSIRGDAMHRTLFITPGRFASGRDSALIATDVRGRVAQLSVGYAPFVRRGPAFPGDSTYHVDRRRRALDGSISLGATRLWDFVPTIPSGPLREGVTWTDTIAQLASDGPFRQSMRGTRLSRVVGTRVVDGHRLWVVHDSASVVYDESYPERERTLDADVTISRTASGTVRGVELYDPELRLYRQRDDTTELRGEATLLYPDGRRFGTRARYDRMRHWSLWDAPHYAARRAALHAAAERGYGGMVYVPNTALEKRLAGGDGRLRDSLLDAWRRSTDPARAASIFQQLVMWGRGDSASAARIEQARIDAGDSAYLYQALARRAYRREPFDSGDVRAMLGFMKDPSLAWSLNQGRDELYENLAQALTTWPPAAVAAPGVPRSVACTPAACELLGEQWPSAREPRLRDLGLVARMAVDPARWADTVLALDGPRHPLLHRAAFLARGVGAIWEAASGAGMPPANSDWHVWLEWMDGRSRESVRWTAQSQLPANMRGDTLPRVRFEESHATAVRFYQARTGRDIVGEWRRQYAEAASDSARLVFGWMLSHIGALRVTEAEVAEGFRSGDPARIALARSSLMESIQRSTTTLDTTTAARVLDRLLAATVDSGPLWESGASDMPAQPRGRPTILHAPRRRIFLNTAGLPASVRARWGSRVELLTLAQWRNRDPREAAVFYTIDPIRSWGRFVRVSFNASERTARTPDQAPAAYASGTTYYLMESNGEWLLVAASGWVT